MILENVFETLWIFDQPQNLFNCFFSAVKDRVQTNSRNSRIAEYRIFGQTTEYSAE